jgi:hypothetical protein
VAQRAVQLLEITADRALLQLPPDISVDEWVWLDIIGIGSRYVLIKWRHGAVSEAMFAAPITEALLHSAVASSGEWTERDSALLQEIVACCGEAVEACTSATAQKQLVTLAQKCRVTSHMISLKSHLERDDEAAARLAARLARLSVADEPIS